MKKDSCYIKIHIANLGKYNEGELIGEWISLPCTKYEWENLMCRIKLGNRDECGNYCHGYSDGFSYYEEWIITDIDTDLNIEINEYHNIQTLNYIAAAINESSNPYPVFVYMQDYEGGYTDIELINALKQADSILYYEYFYQSDCNSKEEKFGYTIAQESNVIGYLENFLYGNLEYYFDYEAYGRDIRINGSFLLLDEGYIDCQASYPNLDQWTEEELSLIHI